MAIPTRDELIEHMKTSMHGWYLDDGDWQRIGALLDTEIRRAVAEELEALRQHSYPVGDVDDHREYWRGVARERGVWIAWIDARLAALREPTKVGEFAGIPIMADPSVKPGTLRSEQSAPRIGERRLTEERRAMELESERGNVAAPALSDADRLRAALKENRERYMELPQWARDAIGVPFGSSAPKPVDVFEATAKRLVRVPGVGWSDEGLERVEAFLRDRFGPLDQLLSEIEVAPGAWQTRAAATRAALRQRAQEASR